MSESSMSHGRDCAVQEEKYPLNRLSPESFPSPTSQCVFAYRSYLRGLLPAAISLTGAVGEKGGPSQRSFTDAGPHWQAAMQNCGVESGRGSTIKSSPQSYESSARSCECAREGARPFYCWTRISVTSVSARLLRAATMTSRQ